MDDFDTFKTQSNRCIAHCYSPGTQSGPEKQLGIVFLGGFMSDMQGTKAVHLEQWARKNGRAFLRFDYSGHGVSGGNFMDGCIGDWADDAAEIITAITTGPQILVGSSMGGWISLLLARDRRADIAGIVTIAAAPDFTEDGFWAKFDDAQRGLLQTKGVVYVPSEYADAYPITKRLIDDGRQNLVLRSPLVMDCPVICLQGDCDVSVDVSTAFSLFNHMNGNNLQLTVVKGADHRFSTPQALNLIEKSISSVGKVFLY